jgi:hypothetical protein
LHKCSFPNQQRQVLHRTVQFLPSPVIFRGNGAQALMTIIEIPKSLLSAAAIFGLGWTSSWFTDGKTECPTCTCSPALTCSGDASSHGGIGFGWVILLALCLVGGLVSTICFFCIRRELPSAPVGEDSQQVPPQLQRPASPQDRGEVLATRTRFSATPSSLRQLGNG